MRCYDRSFTYFRTKPILKKVMKKLSLLVGGIILSGAVLAQKPSSDVPMTLEGQLGITNPAGGAGLDFVAPSVRFRYFLTDNIAARVTLGINSASSTNTVYENPDFSGATGEYHTVSTAWNAAIGAEYHFAGTDRLSPYVGLDIMFGGAKTKVEGTNTDGTGTAYVADASFDSEDPTSMFGVGLALGTDFYFAENFYVGVEMGMAWRTITTKPGSYSNTAGGTTVSGDLNGESKDGQFFTGNLPTGATPTGNIRLGWRF